MGFRVGSSVICGAALACACGGRSGLDAGHGTPSDAPTAGVTSNAGGGAGEAAAPLSRGGNAQSGTAHGGEPASSAGNGGAGGRGGATSDGGSAVESGGAAVIDAGRRPDPLPPLRTAECLTGEVRTTDEGLSYDGRWFVYSDDVHVVLVDRHTGATSVVSRELTDVELPAISGDGNRILFGAGVGNETTAYVWDRVTQGVFASFLVGDGVLGVLSYDGRFLGFYTRDATFSDPPPDSGGGAMVVDLSDNERWQASVNDLGEAGSDYSYTSDISDDGERVVFRSVAMNLIPGKPNRRWDVYLYDRATRKVSLLAHTAAGGYPDAYTYDARISGDGRTVAFVTQAADVLVGDTPNTNDLFIGDLATGVVTSPTLWNKEERTIVLENLSTDGRLVLFRDDTDEFVPEDANGNPDGFVFDRAFDHFDLVTRARNGAPLERGGVPVAFSGNGHVVAFRTQSPELSGDGGGFVTCFSVRE